MTRIPYFYIIEHVSSGKKYAGIRTAKKCHPDELLKENGYLTSSSTVKSLIKNEGFSAFKIIETKTDVEDLLEYETKFLIENDCAKSLEWFNGHDNQTLLPHNSEKIKMLILLQYGTENISSVEAIKEKKRKSAKNRYGVDCTLKAQEVRQKIKLTMIEKYGVDCYSKTKEHRTAQQEKFLELSSKQQLWVQQKENKKIISETTKKQAKEGNHPFQTKEYREFQSKKKSIENKTFNESRKNRFLVKELKKIYAQMGMKEPRGGIWIKSDDWLSLEHKRLLENTNV